MLISQLFQNGHNLGISLNYGNSILHWPTSLITFHGIALHTQQTKKSPKSSFTQHNIIQFRQEPVELTLLPFDITLILFTNPCAMNEQMMLQLNIA